MLYSKFSENSPTIDISGATFGLILKYPFLAARQEMDIPKLEVGM